MAAGATSYLLSLVIPCYNESGRLPLLFDGLTRFAARWDGPLEILVVDDGSSDGTAEKVAAHPFVQAHPGMLRVIAQENTGKGGALRTGVLAATGDWILTLDADMASTPSELFSWRDRVGTFDARSVYIGSREHPESVIRKEGDRKVAGSIFNTFVRVLTPLRTRDSQCGFKLYPAGIKPIFEDLQTWGWAHDVEILYRAHNAGFRIVDMPVTWTAVDGSKIRLFRDGWAMLLEIFRIARLVRRNP